MLVKDFIEKFRWFNPNADLFINGKSINDVKVNLILGTANDLQLHNCSMIDITLNPIGNMTIAHDLDPNQDQIIDHVMCPGPSHCFNREYDPGQSDCQHCYDPPIDPDIPSFLRKG